MESVLSTLPHPPRTATHGGHLRLSMPPVPTMRARPTAFMKQSTRHGPGRSSERDRKSPRLVELTFSGVTDMNRLSCSKSQGVTRAKETQNRMRGRK